jgi:hypothetical protein
VNVRNRWRLLAVRVSLALVSFIIGLLMMEGVARLACRSCDPSGGTTFTHLPDGTAIGPPNVTSRQIKNTGDFDVAVEFNQLGFRDRKSLQAAPAGSLFVVGDSFAFGWGVEESDRFSNRLEKLLARPVFNIAVGSADFDGYDTLIRYAQSHGARIDRLIVSVCMENDLRVYETSPSTGSQELAGRSEDRLPDRPLPDGPQGEEPLPLQTTADLKSWLARRSALRFAVTRAVHSTPWLRSGAIRLGLVIPNAKDAAESDISDEAIGSSVSRLRRLIGTRSAVVLIIPSRGLWVGRDDHRKTVQAAHRSFVRQLRDSAIAVVDVMPLLEREGNPMAYHFAYDGHWNAEGHRIAADALAQYLHAH